MEPEADLVEEVLRLQGLDTIPPVSMPPVAPLPQSTLTAPQIRAALVRRTLAARGFMECVTFSFMAHEQAALFAPDSPELRLSNPIAADLDQMRPTPVATLALAAQRNAARGLSHGALGEVGPAFGAEGQSVIAAGMRFGAPARHWAGAAPPPGALEAKADALVLLAALGVPAESLSVTADAPGFYHPGRSGVLRQGPKLVLAHFGELHPRVLAALGLAAPVVAFEVHLGAIPEPKRRRRAAPDLPALQPLRRDFAFLAPATVPAEAVLRAARGAERTLITGATLFDVYEGGTVPPGQRSLGVEVVIQPREATLTDAAIEAVCAKVVAAVSKATGATLRT